MAQFKEIDIASLIDDQNVSWFRALIMFWSCAVMFLEGYDMQVAAFAAPSIIKAWHANEAYFGTFFGFGLLGYMIGAILLSSLADGIGRRRIIISGVLFFGVFTLATGFATSLTGLVVLRFIAGLGLGASIPTTIALAVEYAPARSRATIVGVLFLGYGIGGTFGGFIAAKIIPEFGWPSVFYIGGIAPMILAFILIFTLPESVRFLGLKQDQSERVARILAKLRPDQTFERDAQFVVREEKRSGLPARNLFTEGRAAMTSLLWFAYIASLMAHYFLTSWLPTVLESSGVPLAHAVIAGALLQAGGGIGGLLLCWLLDKRGILALITAYVVAAPLVILIPSVRMSDMLLMPLVFLAGICLVGAQAGLNGISGTFYPTYIRATGAGWALGVGRIGSILGPVLGGVLVSFNLPNSVLFSYAAVPALCCAGALFLLGRSTASARARQEPVVP